MGMAISETDNGTKQVVADTMRDYGVALPEAIAAELDTIWDQIRNDAIDLCPKESGALASSIELESEGGSGARGIASVSGNEFYHNAIYAGNDDTHNERGQPTSLYVNWVHDGHKMPNGSFWEGVPFLTQALENHEAELEEAVDRALQEMGALD